MELSEEQLQQLKKEELELLQALIAVCSQLGLTYYILGGTLLGAVRHQGFIPWDDDIDVGIPRADYEILMARGQELLPEGIFLQNFRTDPDYPLNFAKLRRRNTCFVEHGLRNCRIDHGIYIDIFPLDYYPENNVRLFRLKDRMMRLRVTFAFSRDILGIGSRVCRWFTLPFFSSRKRTVEKREEMLRSVPSGNRLANHCGAWGEKEIVPAHWYGEGTQLLFEGITVRAPAEYHLWLTQVYGSYQQLPPEDKRRPHHCVDDFALDRCSGEECG